MDGGTWWAAVHGVPKSWAQLSDFTFTFHFHALEKEMATHSSTLAWRIPWMEEPGGLPSLGSHRVGHDWSDLAAAAAAHCRQHNDVSLSYRDINVSYLFDKWSICGWEQADKVSRKDCRIEGFFFLSIPCPLMPPAPDSPSEDGAVDPFLTAVVNALVTVEKNSTNWW